MNANRKEDFARFREALGVQLALSGAEGLRVALDRSNALPKSGARTRRTPKALRAKLLLDSRQLA
jgi:hypothetical protein